MLMSYLLECNIVLRRDIAFKNHLSAAMHVSKSTFSVATTARVSDLEDMDMDGMQEDENSHPGLCQLGGVDEIKLVDKATNIAHIPQVMLGGPPRRSSDITNAVRSLAAVSQSARMHTKHMHRYGDHYVYTDRRHKWVDCRSNVSVPCGENSECEAQ